MWEKEEVVGPHLRHRAAASSPGAPATAAGGKGREGGRRRRRRRRQWRSQDFTSGYSMYNFFNANVQ